MMLKKISFVLMLVFMVVGLVGIGWSQDPVFRNPGPPSRDPRGNPVTTSPPTHPASGSTGAEPGVRPGVTEHLPVESSGSSYWGPASINIQGRVTQDGQPVPAGTVIEFALLPGGSIYGGATVGENGIFNGSVDSFDVTNFNFEKVEFRIGGETIGEQLFKSVPYAVNARNAHRLGGKTLADIELDRGTAIGAAVAAVGGTAVPAAGETGTTSPWEAHSDGILYDDGGIGLGGVPLTKYRLRVEKNEGEVTLDTAAVRGVNYDIPDTPDTVVSGGYFIVGGTGGSGLTVGVRGESRGLRSRPGAENIGGYFAAENAPGNFGVYSAAGRNYFRDRVGIGIEHPSEKLEVNGTVKAAAFVGDGSGLTGLPSSPWALSGSNAHRSAGRVGIGTTFPDSTLHVVGGFHLADASPSTFPKGFTWPSAQDLTFGTYNFDRGSGTYTEKVRITRDGKVGIGINPPSEKLDVLGTVKATVFVGDGSGLTGLSSSPWTLSGSDVHYTAGKVGIGTNTPQSDLDVKGQSLAWGTRKTGNMTVRSCGDEVVTKIGAHYTARAGSVSRYGVIGTITNDDLVFYSNGLNRMVLKKDGKVELNDLLVENELTVNGDLRVSSLPPGSGSYVLWNSSDGKFSTNVSSARYKENILDLEVDSSLVLELTPRSFNWKEGGGWDIGLIAEEVEEVIPELVMYNKDGQPESVKYDKVAIYLLGVVKEQQSRIEALEAKLGQ